MILSEVALGKRCELNQASYMESAPKGYHSTMGVGKMTPNLKQGKLFTFMAKRLGTAFFFPAAH